jgi:ligand-binding SRPBCC domain-containing protein
MVIICRNEHAKGWVLRTELWTPASVDDVFALFADAYQLEAITPPWLHFHVITPRPIVIQQGTLIDYRLRLHGVPIRWQSEITAWEPPFRFVDEQRRGPYRKWRHEHTFEELNGGTLCRDCVEYDVPGGPLIHWLVVARDIRRIFEYRRDVFPRVLERSQERVP